MTDSVVNKLVTENYSTKSRNLYPTKKLKGKIEGQFQWWLWDDFGANLFCRQNSIEIRIGTLIDKNINIKQKCTALLVLKKCENLFWNRSLYSKDIANYVFLIFNTTNIAIPAVLGFLALFSKNFLKNLFASKYLK